MQIVEEGNEKAAEALRLLAALLAGALSDGRRGLVATVDEIVRHVIFALFQNKPPAPPRNSGVVVSGESSRQARWNHLRFN